MTMETTTGQTVRRSGEAPILAAAVGLLLILGIRLIGALPGDWLGWILQCWGMV